MYRRDGRGRQRGVLGDGEEFVRRHNVQQMVWHALQFRQCRFAGADIQAAIHLAGVRADNFPVKTVSKLYRQASLAAGRGTAEHQQR